jgi:hypothetical protein
MFPRTDSISVETSDASHTGAVHTCVLKKYTFHHSPFFVDYHIVGFCLLSCSHRPKVRRVCHRQESNLRDPLTTSLLAGLPVLFLSGNGLSRNHCSLALAFIQVYERTLLKRTSRGWIPAYARMTDLIIILSRIELSKF